MHDYNDGPLGLLGWVSLGVFTYIQRVVYPERMTPYICVTIWILLLHPLNMLRLHCCPYSKIVRAWWSIRPDTVLQSYEGLVVWMDFGQGRDRRVMMPCCPDALAVAL